MPTPPDRVDDLEQKLQRLRDTNAELQLAMLELEESMRLLEKYTTPQEVEQ